MPMIELALGLVFIALMILPFTLGGSAMETEFPSLGLIILGLAYLAYFNHVFLPLPTIINQGLIASFAILDAMFEVFFGASIAEFGGGNLILFVISLSITYSLLKFVFGSIPILSPRAQEFITLAVLFIIARSAGEGTNYNLVLILSMVFIQVFFPQCGVVGAGTIFGPVAAAAILIIFGVSMGAGGKVMVAMIIIGLLLALSPILQMMGLVSSFQICIYGWLVQLALILFGINLVLQWFSMDLLAGIYDEMGMNKP